MVLLNEKRCSVAMFWQAAVCALAAAFVCGGCGGGGGGDDELETSGISPTQGVGNGVSTQASTGPVGASDSTSGSLPKFDAGSFPATGTSGENCAELVATIRDFEASHADFEAYTGNGATVGLVETALGSGGKPTLNEAGGIGPGITSVESFADWYADVPGTNMAFEVSLPLAEESPGVYVYENDAFFPLDGMGFGDGGNPHNFHFTTELHTQFTYHGGEVLTFRGDDDLWLFVDGALALDLGGVHPVVEGTVEMDGLGLNPGGTYAMDIFHAERHTTESNFRISTNIDCFVAPVG